MASIVEELVVNVDVELLLESRDIIFRFASERYIELLRSENAVDESALPVLVLKKRRGDNSKVNTSKDIYDLVVYGSGLSDIFPRDVLAHGCRYVELKNANSENSVVSLPVDKSETQVKCLDCRQLFSLVKEQKDAISLMRLEILNLTSIVTSVKEMVGKGICEHGTTSPNIVKSGNHHANDVTESNTSGDNSSINVHPKVNNSASQPSVNGSVKTPATPSNNGGGVNRTTAPSHSSSPSPGTSPQAPQPAAL